MEHRVILTTAYAQSHTLVTTDIFLVKHCNLDTALYKITYKICFCFLSKAV